MDPRSAYLLINDELKTQGNPTLNMASFVTTIMDEECGRLISENLGVNYIDTEVYRANLEIQNRCVAILNPDYSVRRAKAQFFSGCKSHPATFAPAGSNRSGSGGNDTAEAFDGKGRLGRLGEQTSRNVSER
jgi:hypothetical protein